jgi:hypothetical protein
MPDHPQSTPDDPKPLPGQDENADHSMKDEPPLGWDVAPVSDDDGEKKVPARHPRTGGKGGTARNGELNLQNAQDATRTEQE